MNQEKRSLLAALLSFIVLMAWFYFFGNPNKKTPPTSQPVVVAPTESPAENKVSQEVDVKASPSVSASNSSSNPSSSTPQPTALIKKENDVLSMIWTNQGATLASLQLKKFTGRKKDDHSLVNLIPYENDKALTLLCDQCNQSLPEDDQYKVISQDDTTVTFEAQKNGLLVKKIYQWNPNQYLFNLKISIENQTAQEFKGRLGMGWYAKQYPKHPKQGLTGFLNREPEDQRNLLYKAENKVLHGVKSGEAREIRGTIPWAGIEDRYFLIALVSRQLSADQILKLENTTDSLKMSFFPAALTIAPQGKQESQYTFYLGPKQHAELETVGVGLEGAVDYGWFGIIAIPILKLLQFFHVWVRNWGLAVIVLTLFIKILTNPLTIKSMKQMKSMQLLQPQLQALKEKYKDDKQRLNMETMALFKKNQVNPMGGCLPMVMQMPIYISLYKVLYNSIELYHAPFFGFYKDLSAPDPYFIFPILLGFAMVLQQRFTPNPSADPTQKQMMMIMPIMFTAFMLFLPVGLVLYIFINTGMSVLQQWMYQKDIRWRDVFRGQFKPSS